MKYICASANDVSASFSTKVVHSSPSWRSKLSHLFERTWARPDIIKSGRESDRVARMSPYLKWEEKQTLSDYTGNGDNFLTPPINSNWSRLRLIRDTHMANSDKIENEAYAHDARSVEWSAGSPIGQYWISSHNSVKLQQIQGAKQAMGNRMDNCKHEYHSLRSIHRLQHNGSSNWNEKLRCLILNRSYMIDDF